MDANFSKSNISSSKLFRTRVKEGEGRGGGWGRTTQNQCKRWGREGVLSGDMRKQFPQLSKKRRSIDFTPSVPSQLAIEGIQTLEISMYIKL